MILSEGKAYYIATVTKTLWCWGWVETRSVEQNGEFRSRFIQMCSISDKGEKQFKGGEIVFSINDAGATVYP